MNIESLNVINNSRSYNKNINAPVNNKYDDIKNTSASTITDKKETNNEKWENFIYKLKDGYSIQAKYSDKSTNDNPIMYVELKETNGGLTALEIDINKIDPKNATRAEIFALTTHKYKGNGEDLFNATIGFTYHEGLSEFNNLDGYKKLDDNVIENVLNQKMDFINVYKQVSSILFNCQDMKSYSRVQDMLSIFATQSSK